MLNEIIKQSLKGVVGLFFNFILLVILFLDCLYYLIHLADLRENVSDFRLNLILRLQNGRNRHFHLILYGFDSVLSVFGPSFVAVFELVFFDFIHFDLLQFTLDFLQELVRGI